MEDYIATIYNYVAIHMLKMPFHAYSKHITVDVLHTVAS